jgi:hypothetical protein
MFLNPTTQLEISQIIDKLKNCATGWDGIPSSVLKSSKNHITSVISHIIDLSLSQGVFPSELKLANIIPIFKAGDKQITGNYRPVSLLTMFSKIYERVFYSRLAHFLNMQKTLFEYQFGFRTNHSTGMALTILLDKIINALEKGHLKIGIFLDFSKAFDTVNHQILLDKLNRYGVRGIANTWIRSYLDKRTQFCTYDGKKSKTKYITCGIPQGSILGPLLFLVYVNDLHSATKNSDIILFADDSNIFSGGKTITEIQNNLNAEMPKLIKWLQANRLSLNVDKTHAMVFGTKNEEIKKSLKVQINDATLEVINKTTFWGVMIDDQLNWKSHVLYTSKKIAKAIGIISMARRVFNRDTLKQFYYAFVYPYLIYGNIVWGKAGKTILWPIFRLQKILIRMMNNIPSRSSSTEYFNQMQILKLRDIHTLTIGLFMYKYKTNSLPNIFNNFFTKNREYHDYPTRSSANYRPPIIKTKIANNFVRKTGTSLWNQLEGKIDTTVKMVTFKRHLKKHILVNDIKI